MYLSSFLTFMYIESNQKCPSIYILSKSVLKSFGV